MRVITNNVPRALIYEHELSEVERNEFDYIDWDAVDAGKETATFMRYKGELYDIGEFSVDYGITRDTGLPDYLARWHGYMSLSFCLAIVIRCVDDEHVVVGRVLS